MMKTIPSIGIICLLFGCQSVFSQDTYFQDVATQAGLQGLIDRVQYGVSWGDFDGDRDEDCFIATHPGNQLFRNQGDGTFIDVSLEAGITDPDYGASGGAWGDYDGDGDLDLFVTNLATEKVGAEFVPNRLFENNNGVFTDVADRAGVSGIVQEVTGGSTGAAWIDYNGDGHLDLMVCNRYRGALLYKNNGDGTFAFASHEAGLIHEHEGEEHEGEEHEEHDHEAELTSVEHAAWGDFDGDGDLDVYFCVAVAAEHTHSHDGEHEESGHEEEHEEEAHETANFLFRNNGDGTFENVTEEAGLHDPNFAVSHCAVWGDYDNDGDLDLFVSNLGSVNEKTAAASRLYRNNGDGTFTEIGETVGLRENYYTFNAAWVDVNNDGFLDLSIVYHPSHADFPAGVLYQYPHPLYLSNGDGTFTNINAAVEDAILITGLVDISHLIGLAWNDMDGDGDLDAVFTENHGDGPIRLYRNDSLAVGRQWLSVALKADGFNTHAVGAKVFVSAGSQTQMRIMGAGAAGWGSSSPLRLHFGLGEQSAAVVTVRWPDGNLESFGEQTAGRRITLIQGEGKAATPVMHWMVY